MTKRRQNRLDTRPTAMAAAFIVAIGITLLSSAVRAEEPTAPEPVSAATGDATDPGIEAVSPTFQELDLNQDGSLSLEEFLKLDRGISEQGLQHRFLVFDRDRNEMLSLEEFQTLPDITPAPERRDLADGLSEQLRIRIEAELSQLPVPVGIRGLEQSWRELLPASIPLKAEFWDRNRDGTIDAIEAETGLEIAYSLRRPDGGPGRRQNGIVFNGSYFNHLDKNRDRVLSREEFVSRHHLGAEHAQALFQASDRNRDDRLTITEIDDAGLFQTDVWAGFLKWDRNQDGLLSADELAAGEAWQLNLASSMIPAFDASGDGQLSFSEFLQSPLSDPLVNWTGARVDTDGDGLLSLKEFFGDDSLCGSGLAAMYFDRLDRNRDGMLDLQEFRFPLHPHRLPPGQLFRLYDRNGDQQITSLELFSVIGRPLLNDVSALLIPNHLKRFQQADLGRNSALSEAEFANAPELHQVSELEEKLRRETFPEFDKLDEDRNGRLSHEEWMRLATVAEGTLRQDFLVADDNGDGSLNFTEFSSIPQIAGRDLRPDVPDPVLDLVQTVMDNVFRNWPTDKAELSASEAARSLLRVCPFFTEADLINWDRNANGLYSRTEIAHGIFCLYMVRTETGAQLRRPNGHVFNMRAFRDADGDRNQRLSRTEFLVQYWKKGAEAETDFRNADLDRDQFLSLSELLQGNLFWVDTQLEFRRLDTNLDGAISSEELKTQARPYERRMASLLFPAFDLNKDGTLSFREFRLTPLANPLHDYESRRWNLDHDGRLSLTEYHRGLDNTRAGIGLSSLFFNRLDKDRDQFLSYREFTYSANLQREPPETVFLMLDTNQDGALTLDELQTRVSPKDHSAWARRLADQREMEIEESFAAADTNRDQSLSLDEFLSDTSNIHQVVLGVNSLKTDRSGRESISGTGTSWRVLAVIGVNLAIFSGIAWRHLRRRR